MTAFWYGTGSAVSADRPTHRTPAGMSARAMLIGAVLCFFVCPADALPAAERDEDLITVEDKIWGFDGRVEVGQFNPVSILIDNRTQDAVDEIAALYRVGGLTGNVSGRQVQPVFLGPGARRWVQFYVYVSVEDHSEWQLELGGRRLARFTQPKFTAQIENQKDRIFHPVVVILDPPGATTRRTAAVRRFPAEIFPPWATATVGLHAVFLDHAPDWEVPRQEAFLSWLRRGGRLKLLKGSQGAWPVFGGRLAVLNSPLNEFSVGAGKVERLDLRRTQISEADVARVEAEINGPTDSEDELDPTTVRNTQLYGNPYSLYRFSPSWMDEHWFEQLRHLTQPNHPWLLIFLLGIVYIGLLFPGCWVLARQKRHFLIIYGTIAALAAVFSVLFLIIGRRGHGEDFWLHTLAVSRIQDDGYQNVLEWDALFVTTGDSYAISAEDQQALFAIAETGQASGAVMTAGNRGQLHVPIPPFSSQGFLCRRRMPAPDWDLKLVSFRSTGPRRVEAVLQGGPGFQIDPDSQVGLLHDHQMYRMKYDAAKRQLTVQASMGNLNRFCSGFLNEHYMNFGWMSYTDDGDASFYQNVFNGLVVRSLLENGVPDPTTMRLMPDRVRLFVYTDAPDSHFVDVNVDCRKEGRVLYVQDFPLLTGDRQPPAESPAADRSGDG